MLNAQQNKRVSMGNVPIHADDYVALEMIFARSTTTYQNANQVRISIFIIFHIPRLKIINESFLLYNENQFSIHFQLRMTEIASPPEHARWFQVRPKFRL